MAIVPSVIVGEDDQEYGEFLAVSCLQQVIASNGRSTIWGSQGTFCSLFERNISMVCGWEGVLPSVGLEVSCSRGKWNRQLYG